MRLRPDLIGSSPFKPVTPAGPAPKPVLKSWPKKKIPKRERSQWYRKVGFVLLMLGLKRSKIGALCIIRNSRKS